MVTRKLKQSGDGEQGGGDDNPISGSETGIGLRLKNNYNHECYSLPGEGHAGVQCEDGVQGGGVVGGDPAQSSTVPQLEPRRVGSFLVSAVQSDSSAVGRGKTSFVGKIDSTISARNTF